jgi:hypothetical protein
LSGKASPDDKGVACRKSIPVRIFNTKFIEYSCNINALLLQAESGLSTGRGISALPLVFATMSA